MIYALYIIAALTIYVAVVYKNSDIAAVALLIAFATYGLDDRLSSLQRQIAQMPDIAHDQISDELSAGGVLWHIREERIDTITRAIDKNTNFRIMHDDPSYDIEEIKKKLRVIREELDEINEKLNL